ncbi:hypothetical protein [Deinococcus radiotolerans]|uniref:ATP-binding protein n=1 Tax=Deinococcus radiotolerans TaxID=1309407 RepID=A0ABQ2FJK1_9DEIO|nr:hypothetical protein [Deinococcus radiotolerans]GGK94995.1 hypothetical protein GCM10010844_11920 [Deinococcus radiotolerans]
MSIGIPDRLLNSQAKGLIDSLCQSFLSSVDGVMDITRNPEYYVHEKGLYSFAISKPIKRIRETFGVNRELLVLMTSFVEQQPRTIEAAKKIIELLEGRVESNTVVIIHSDPAGNTKLRLWGREAGISIIPIYINERLGKINEFEKNLIDEFYSFDPFDVSGPVSEEGRFFGRKNEALEISRQIVRGEIKSFLGIRKIGKTSLIHRIKDDLSSHDNLLIIMIDCSRDAVSMCDDAGLMNSLAEAIQNSGSRTYVSPSIPKNRNPDIVTASENLLKQIIACSKSIVFIFDEIDYITPSSPTNNSWNKNFNPFWRNFRSIFQDLKRQGKIVSLVVCGVSGFWFREESISGVENAALSFIPENYLTPLSENASVSMIRELGLLCGIRFGESVPEMIAKECGYIPFWMRKAGSYIHQKLLDSDKPYNLSQEEAKVLLATYIEEDGILTSSVAIKHLFRVDPATKLASEKFLSGHKILSSEELTLHRYGILKRQSGKYSFSGALFENAIQDYFKNKNTFESDGIVTPKNEAQFGEWAEELALLSRRMNILESNLRSLILNFIRASYLKDKSQTTDDRIKSCLSQDRRKQLAAYSKEALMDKLYWIELKNIICKEWSIFEFIFSDQSKLKSAFETLNDRPYAHAKPLDIYSIALYRRELDWIEDKMSKI